MKTFDFEEALNHNSKEKVDWYKANHKKPITLEQFLLAMQELRKITPNRLHLSKRYSKAHLKGQYKNLKEEFGFFK